MLGHDNTSRLIRPGPIRQPVRPSKGQSGVLQTIDHSVARSMTAQPPESLFSTFWVAAIRWGVLLLCKGEIGIFYSPSRQGEYSPDLAPSNYWLLARPQKNAPGKRFGSKEKVKSETEAYFEAKDKSFYKKGINQEEGYVEFCLNVIVLLVNHNVIIIIFFLIN